jgi:glucose/mannose transport system substrate-binding protein
LALAATACGSDDEGSTAGAAGGTSTESVKVEVFSWWTAPGEAEALQELVALHRENYPRQRIYNAATDPAVISGGEDAKAVLRTRLDAGDPPDAFQTNAYEVAGLLEETPDLLQPLDDIFEEQDLTDNVAPEVLSQVTFDGNILAVPVNVHRENGLFYNITIFDEHGLQPPTTMAEFLDVCEKLKAEGVTPLAISTSQNWIINKVFVALALGSMGPDNFVKYFHDKVPVDPEVFAPAIEIMDKVLTDYIDVEQAATDGFGWTQSADAMREGKAAMFIHGDWAKGYLVQLGSTPNVDFGVVSSPDSGGAFIYGMDVFAVPSGAKHPTEALDFVRTVSSSEGQVRFNEWKGSSPVRLNVDDSDLDPMAKEIYADFKNSEHRLPTVGIPAAWDEGLGQLAKDHDQEALLQIMIDNPL